MAGDIHLVDFLLNSGVAIKENFCSLSTDFATWQMPVRKSRMAKMYRPACLLSASMALHRKPTPEDLSGIDVVIFDIQDVGVRFYTYLGTLHYLMEACAENNVEVLILDRPDPNGFYVDGNIPGYCIQLLCWYASRSDCSWDDSEENML
ncbi:MAG: DUF1343 domain-containing protein [Marinilabiliales bacterium]|nr:DUF1343 domain-containing protein [Marinilabiliales bacterium]